jgi:signal transduction histidine kinase
MSTSPRPRILIVDDNPAIHGDFRKVLGVVSQEHATPSDSEAALFGEPVATQPTESAAPDDSYEIDDALQGEEALAKVIAARKEGRPYSMTFLDVRMPPGWDGVQTARALWDADPDLQVVLCTAFSDYTWPQTVAALGRTDRLLILKKPFDSVEVCQLAASLTEKRASLQRERENLAAARKAELEARAYAASLETMNRALQSSWAQADSELRRRNEFLQRLSSEVLAPAQRMLLESLDLDALAAGSASANLDLDKLLDPAISVVSAIAAVLELSAIGSGNARANVEPCSPSEIAERIAARARESSHCVGVTVEARVESHVPTVIRGDAARIERILDELVANAVRHAAARNVELSVARDAQPGMLSITVRDDGAGLSRSAEAHMFEPFHADDGSRAGLGLALARRTATLLGGELSYEPQEGRGACFRLRLPTRETNA